MTTPCCEKRRVMSNTSLKPQGVASCRPSGKCLWGLFLPFCTAIRMTYQAGCKSEQKVRHAQARARQEEMAGSEGFGEPGNHRDSSLLLLQQQPKNHSAKRKTPQLPRQRLYCLLVVSSFRKRSWRSALCDVNNNSTTLTPPYCLVFEATY